MIGFSAEHGFGIDFDAQIQDGSDEVLVIDRATGVEAGRVSTEDGFLAAVLDRGTEVWLSTLYGKKIFVFDPGCVCLTREIPVDALWVEFMIEYGGHVWIGDYAPDLDKYVLSAINPVTGVSERQIVVEDRLVTPSSLDTALELDGKIWVTGSGQVFVVDLATGDVVREGIGEGGRLELLEYEGLVIVADRTSKILSIDSVDMEVRQSIGPLPTDDGSYVISSPVIDDVVENLWVVRYDLSAIIASDPVTLDELGGLSFDGSVVGQPVVAGGYVWVPVDNRLFAIDPATVTVAARLPGVESSDPWAFEVHKVDETLWLTPTGDDTRRTYILEER